jgi:alkylresorcinol/alkylpyrone synthase
MYGRHQNRMNSPRIVAVETAVPPYQLTQAGALDFARAHFGRFVSDIDRLLPVFANSGIESRYFSVPTDWFSQPHTLAEKNRIYIESATDLCTQAARSAMARADISANDIDYIVYVNTTGIATPSIDARLINRLGLRSNVRRIPIWGLGCAGGAAGLSHAYHYLLGHPNETVLVVCAELCGLTFLSDDFSRSNLVASALFGEGAAAVILRCASENVGVEMVATNSRFFPDSLDVMGWNVVEAGLQVVFAQRIPDIVAAHANEDFQSFLNSRQLALDDIDQFLFHPGGTKVIAAYETALGINNGKLDHSRCTLRDFGNMSSVTVLFVLKRFLDQTNRKRDKYSLLSALGPGFCSESVLIRT